VPDEISFTAGADANRVRHTREMDLDLARNFLDFVQGKQTEAAGIESHGRLYDPVHHNKLGTYWDAARHAHTALVNGMRDYDASGFTKWKPSQQLFDLMKGEMASRGLPPFEPKGPVVRKKI
jgi:hypothetical protein